MGLALGIVRLIAQSDNGKSYWDLHKEMGVSESLVRYHLKNLKKAGILQKDGSKYQINSEVMKKAFIYKDGIMVKKDERVFFLDCPYTKVCEECGDGNVDPEKCRYWGEIKEFFT